MATAAPQIFLQYNDDDGDPLNAGTVTAYTAGTTNLKDIYSDAAGTVADNPITLDSAGRVDFYLGTGTYDFLIKDSTGATVDTKDDVSSIADGGSHAFVDNLAAMKALAAGAYDYVTTGGYTTKGDGGHSTYRWDATSSTADDAGLVVQPDSAPGTGRWLLQNSGYINDLQLGDSGDLELTATSGDININSDLIFVGSVIGLSYGSMYIYEATTTVTIATQNVYTKFTGLTAGNVNNTTFTTSALTVANTGLYFVQWNVSTDNMTGNANYTIAVHVNGVLQQPTAGRVYEDDDYHTTSGCGIIDVTDAAHDIDLRVRNITDTNDFKYTNMNIVIFQLAGT